MAKTLIRNKLGNNNIVGMALSCGAEKAKAFADEFLQGEYAIYERKQSAGNEVEAEFYRTTITGKSQAGLKTTFTLLTKAGKNENEVMNAFKELTINGVKLDEVYIISMSKVVA